MEPEPRLLKLEASVVVSKAWLRPALLPLMPNPFGMMSDSWSQTAFPLGMVPVVTVVPPGRDGIPEAVVSETVMLMPLTPETAERVSASILISALPRNFWALFVMGAEMD